MDSKELERENIRRCVSSHPILLVRGPEQTGVLRSVEAILGLYCHSDDEWIETEEMVWNGTHPDLTIYDGRELKAEEARQLRQSATLFPALWDRRFVILSYIHRPHYVVMPILLKLVEEPHNHFSMIFTTSNERRVLPTIISRSLRLKIAPSDESEVKWWLNRLGKTPDDLQLRACGGDLGVAENLDLALLKLWYRDWSAVLIGDDFHGSFLQAWTSRLEEASEPTQVACWDLLTQLVAESLHRNRFWVDIGMVSMEARNSVQHGWMNKMLSTVMLFRVYAIAKTILTRTSK